MKRFVTENGKEKVFIQVKDLRFIDKQNRTPASVKKLLNMNNLNANKQEEYFEFSNPEFVKYLKEAFFILDYDKFNSMTDEAISKEFDQNLKNMDKIQREKRKIKRKSAVENGLNDALVALVYYQGGIADFVSEKRRKKGLK